MNYKILASRLKGDLEEEVVDYLNDGWVLQGGVSCSMSESDDYRYIIFCQAIIKNDDTLSESARVLSKIIARN